MKQIFKAADFVFEVPAGQSFWGADMHEPLLFALFVFPFIRSKPWQLRSAPKLLELGRELRKVFKEERFGRKGFSAQTLGQVSPAWKHAGECGAEAVILRKALLSFTSPMNKICTVRKKMRIVSKKDGNQSRAITESILRREMATT